MFINLNESKDLKFLLESSGTSLDLMSYMLLIENPNDKVNYAIFGDIKNNSLYVSIPKLNQYFKKPVKKLNCILYTFNENENYISKIWEDIIEVKNNKVTIQASLDNNETSLQESEDEKTKQEDDILVDPEKIDKSIKNKAIDLINKKKKIFYELYNNKKKNINNKKTDKKVTNKITKKQEQTKTKKKTNEKETPSSYLESIGISNKRIQEALIERAKDLTNSDKQEIILETVKQMTSISYTSPTDELNKCYNIIERHYK